MQRVDKSSKTAEKLEYFAKHDLGNIQNLTPSMHLLNTSLLYRKDNLGTHSRNVYAEDRFFQEEVLLKERAG